MSDLLISTVKQTISEHGLLAPGDRVAVAVSGGPDSVCLLAVLRELAPDWGLSLHLAHLDHMFRGEGSAADARFVQDLARRWELPTTIERIDVPAYCAERGLSPQAGARELRYRFLERTADAVKADRIATGHTADDQAETLLMRLVRGAGLAGLSGIPPRRGRIVRPLLTVTRQAVLDFLASRKLPFVTDPSNSSPVYTRNRVRSEVLPVLERLNPRAVEALAHAASLLRDEEAAQEQAADALLDGLLLQQEDEVRIDRDRFLGLLPAMQRRGLRRAAGLAAPGTDLSSVRMEEALGFAGSAQTGRAMDLVQGLVLAREYASLVLRPSAAPFAFDRELVVPGTTVLPDLELEVITEFIRAGNDRTEKGNYLWQAEFDYAKIALPLRLRSRRPGDAFHPAGMAGSSKKLQDLFVDAKVPRALRDRVPLLASDRDLLWVLGHRTDGRFLPGPGTVQVLRVTIKNISQGDRR